MSITQPSKTEPALIAALQSQALVRIKLGPPVIVLMVLTAWLYGSPYGTAGLNAILIVSAAHIAYAIITLYIVFRKTIYRPARTIVFFVVLVLFLLFGFLLLFGVLGALF